MPDGQPLATLTGHTDGISAISFSPDGKTLATTRSSLDGTIILWSSYVLQLKCLTIKQLCQQNREWVEKVLQDDEIAKGERHWLEFMQTLMNWHQRFDVEVENAPQLIHTGEFDIEIEG